MADAMAALGADTGGMAWRIEVCEGVTTPTGREARYPVRARAKVGGRTVRLWYTAGGELARVRPR